MLALALPVVISSGLLDWITAVVVVPDVGCGVVADHVDAGTGCCSVTVVGAAVGVDVDVGSVAVIYVVFAVFG